MSGEVLIRTEAVSKKFCRSLKRSLWYGVRDVATELMATGGNHECLRRDEFWAVKDVSFELRRGECLGLIGRNGAGKTTLLKMLNGLIKPDHGKIEMRGRVGALIALGAGFNPILTGRENIYVNASVLGISKQEIDAKIDDIIDFADIREFIDAPVQSYSSGMHVRLGFAVASALEPDVLLLDEVLAVGDATFRSKCFQRIGRILEESCVIFVSHDPIQVARICDYCLYMKRGELAGIGLADEMLERYRRDTPEANKPSVVLAESVKRFDCQPNVSRLRWGDVLELTVSLEFESKQQAIGSAVLSLREGELSVAQAEVTDQLIEGLAAGGPILLQLGPLHLRDGVYTLALSIFNKSRKSTLVHVINYASVELSGPRGFGVPYQPPLSAEQPAGPTQPQATEKCL